MTEAVAAGVMSHAHPKRFERAAQAALPWMAAGCALLLAAAFYVALFVAPEDYRQGQTARIMFVHVPAAWLALGIYVGIAVASAVGWIWKIPLADIAARAAAPIGAGFTLLCLVTGALWGKPMWGTWWVWDARLTSVAILLLLYLGYMALWSAIDDVFLAARAAAALAILGSVNIPVIHFSVEWWNTLHQPASLLRLEGPAIHGSLLWPLLLMAAAFALFGATCLLARMRVEILRRRARMLELRGAG